MSTGVHQSWDLSGLRRREETLNENQRGQGEEMDSWDFQDVRSV